MVQEIKVPPLEKKRKKILAEKRPLEQIKAPPLKRKGDKSQVEKINELMDYLQKGGSLGLKLEKRLEELPSSYAALLVTRQDNYDLLIANLTKTFANKGMPGIFVTVNKSGKELLKMLQKNGIDCSKLFIVDAISKEEGKGKEGKISYVGSAQDLTEMAAQISDFAESIPSGKKFFILDSLSTLLVYNADKTIEKFVHTMSEKLRTAGFNAVFTIMKETRPEIMNVLAQFCDKVIRTNPQIKP